MNSDAQGERTAVPPAADPPAAAGRPAVDAADPDATDVRAGGRPLVPVLTVLLVLLLAAAGLLWWTRPGATPVSTADYAPVLGAARTTVADLTSFDYRTLDQDLDQARRLSTGDLRRQSEERIEGMRQQLVATRAVVSTEVIVAGVTRADEDRGTVLLVLQSTQRTGDDPKGQVVRYPVRAQLEKVGGRWLLSGISQG